LKLTTELTGNPATAKKRAVLCYRVRLSGKQSISIIGQSTNIRNLLVIIFLLSVLFGFPAIINLKCSELKETQSNHKQLINFRTKINKDLTPDLTIEIFGKPDRIVGSGLTIFVYTIENQNELWIGFPGEAPLLYAFIKNSDGSKTNLFP
jgi:hypothetical protein